MKFRKVLSVIISFSLLFGASFATSGSFVNRAYASEDSFINQDFLDFMIEIHDEMYPSEKAAVNAARASLTAANWDAILAEIYVELNLDNVQKTTLKNLIISAVNTLYSPTGAGIEALRKEPAYHALLQGIATPAGVVDLTVDDIVEFLFSAQIKLNDKLKTLSLAELAKLATDAEYRNDVAVEVVEQVLTVNNPLNTVFKYYFEENDRAILSSFITEVLEVDNVLDSALALFSAYLRVEGIGTNPGGDDGSGGDGGSGGNGGSGGGSGGGIGGGGVPNSPATDTPAPVQAVKQELENIKNNLANASEAEKANLIRDAVNKAAAAMEAAGKIDVANTLKTEGDKSVAELSVDDVKQKIAALKQAAEDLKNQLKELGVSAPDLKLSLTIDLGNLNTSKGEVKIPADILTEALNAGFANANVVINGVAVALPVAEFQKDTSLEIGTRSPSEADGVTDKPIASEIVDFSLTVGGQPVTSFATPIQIRIPVNVNGKDKELLAVAKLVDGQLVIVGGRLDGDVMVESRDTFSSYLVVENKVSFNDIDSVKSWAGRQIEVIAAKGAIVGKSEGVFAPQDNVTRGEFARMLIGALDLENASAKENFADVNASDWFAPYVAAAVKHGIIAGRSADQFEPNATITRAEMAAMITRALKATQNLDTTVSNADDLLKDFADASSIHPSLRNSVAFAVSKGLLFGDAGKLDPNGNATRAQAAVMLYRVLNYTN